MTIENDTPQFTPYTRTSPGRTRPKRVAGGFYRTAEGPGEALGGIPLTNINDAVVGAVRMAYKVAEVQIDRSSRLAKRLRDAGDQAIGPDSGLKSLDAAERLVFRAMMGGLTWLESAAAAERGSPLKRLAEAQYKMMGSLFGLAQSETPQTSPDSAAATSPAQPDGAGVTATGALPKTASAGAVLEIRHLGPAAERRPVRIARWEIVVGTYLRAPVKVYFFCVDKIDNEALEADFAADGKAAPTLSIETKRAAQAGLWRGAICDSEGLQLGLIEIIL